MKFILSFLFTFIFISPVFATITTEEECSVYNAYEQCSTYPGCYWSEFEDIPCKQCTPGFECVNGNMNQCTNTLGAHQQHPAGASSCDDFICTDGYIKSADGQSCVLNCSGITEPKFLPDGETNCDNWQCRAGYYRGGTNNDECKTCPSNSDNCTTNGGNYGLTTATVTCEYGYVKSVSNGIVTCSTCPEHAEQSGNTCICTTGYYGDGNTCTACPYGTTSAAGSTAKSACHMTQNTKFCDANGENCMKLLSGANNINQ